MNKEYVRNSQYLYYSLSSPLRDESNNDERI